MFAASTRASHEMELNVMPSISEFSREIQYYKGAARIIYHNPDKKKRDDKLQGKPKGSKIREYTPRTAVRLNLHLTEFSEKYKHEITVTYPAEFPTDGLIVRKHRHELLRRLKRHGVKNYTTCLEFQERGAPHIHVLVDKWVNFRKLKNMWFKIVGSGDPLHLEAGTSINDIQDITKTRMYMSAYARKKDQKEVPEGYENVGKWWTSNDSAKPHEIESCEYDTQREMHRENRQITRWRKAVKRTVERKSGKKHKKWNVRTGKGFLAWGEKDSLKGTIERLKPQADDSVPF